MIGERYYGANASTFIGIATVVVSAVSLLSALATEVAVIEVGSSQAWSVAASILGLLIGGALIASRETVGGIMAILLTFSLFANGVSINFKQLFSVAEGAYNGVATAANAIKSTAHYQNTSSNPGVGQNALFQGYVRGEAISAVARQQCEQGAMPWTKTMAGVRACTTGYEWKKQI
ncbi:MAG: hypothetical protein JG718_09620 [Candidatus Thiothrix moscowensis]|nr:hypothetical protein [Candidatus Thiothrix moscowensis]